jgi:hypothetical protein
MQCPRCGATVPDTMSRCGRCDSPLQPAAGHEPVATPAHDGPPPIQQVPLGAPVYEGGAGPPVQAFVESAEDAWHAVGQQRQFPPDVPAPAASPAVPPANEPLPPLPRRMPPAQPPGDIGEPPGEATQMWTPPPAFGDPPAATASGPNPAVPRHAAPEGTDPRAHLGLPLHDSMATDVPSLGTPSLGGSSMGGSSLDPGRMGQPPIGRPPVDQAPTDQPPMAQPSPLQQHGLPQEPAVQDSSVAERTMALWLSDSSHASPDSPTAMHDPSSQTPAYGSMLPPRGGQGGNETAVLPPDIPPGQHPAGWQPEPWRQPGPGGFGPGGPGGPSGPGGPPPQRQTGGASKPLIFTVVGLVAVALVAAVFVLWPDGDDKTPAAATGGPSQAAANTPAPASKTNSVARREAVSVNKVLNASAASRGELARAITTGGTCKGLPTAIAGFQRVATQRRAQMAYTRRLKVGHLANGARLRQTLARSIQYSLAADQAFLTWAHGKQGCHGRPKPDANYRRARGPLSVQASAAKHQFAILWAPVAKQHRLPSRTANGF